MRSNLGRVKTATRRRARCPMQVYDDLPLPLRRWVAQAQLPWSPQSCRRIWAKARAEGMSGEDALARLEAAERAMLSRLEITMP